MLLIVDMDIENDARTAQIINIALPVGSIGPTLFKLSNADIITIKTPINVPTNESIVNANLNICILITPFQVQYYTIQHQVGHNHKTS